MKSNIDLTENQMFSRQQFVLRGITRYISGIEFPWCFSLMRMVREEFEAIRTGDKEERESKKLCDEAISGNYCDRCGVYLVNVPWNRTYGLCHKCHDELEKEMGTMLAYPWENETAIKPNNALFSLSW